MGFGGGGGGGGGIEAFFSPSMLENPWEWLERRMLGGQQQQQQQQGQQQQGQGQGQGGPQPAAAAAMQGRAADEGALDRPWH